MRVRRCAARQADNVTDTAVTPGQEANSMHVMRTHYRPADLLIHNTIAGGGDKCRSLPLTRSRSCTPIYKPICKPYCSLTMTGLTRTTRRYQKSRLRTNLLGRTLPRQMMFRPDTTRRHYTRANCGYCPRHERYKHGEGRAYVLREISTVSLVHEPRGKRSNVSKLYGIRTSSNDAGARG